MVSDLDMGASLRFKKASVFPMNKSVLLLVVIGLAVAGWMNRETISGWVAQRSGGVTETDEPAPAAEPVTAPATPAVSVKSAAKPATPNPAPQAVAQARQTYPALATAGSPFNARFVALYNESKASNPNFLAGPNWPMQLAERTAKELGVAAMPRSGALGITGWTENYAAAVESAKIDNKKLLLDFTGSDWCVWCTKFDDDVLSQPEFAGYAKTNLVMVMLDFPHAKPQSDSVKKTNNELQEKFKVDGFPTYVALTPDGNEIGRQIGYLSGGPRAFIAELEKFLKQ